MRQHVTTYFDGEGRAFMQDCMRLAAEWCATADLEKLVIFTGTGEGPFHVAKDVLTQERYAHLQVVAVTPPFGRPYRSDPADPESPIVRAGINPAMRDALNGLGISVVSAHLPFKEIHTGRERESEWSRVAEAYGVLGGGLALCVQAALLACDAGSVESGERVVVASADTAFVAIASRTDSFLSPINGLLIEHIICRPARYTISKRNHSMLQQMWAPRVLEHVEPDDTSTTTRNAQDEEGG